MTSLTPFRNVCPVTYSRFLLENFMKYQVREFINEKYAKAVNLLKDNLKENYHVFYGVRLSEILFPASEYGTDAFFKEFESINSVILPLVIFDLIQRKPMMIISFDKILDASLLEGTNIVVLECTTLADLLTNDNIDSLYKS
ncbi:MULTISPECIES: DNA distortion polypeptide 3 [Enterobacteriaceae]|nr:MULTISPECIES: DNA distortion polypeptide 3 [Enterobacteriaceae]EHQ0638712.1 DNA distortion polypeptide 3 [Salmonella enterica subsp. enterica serovar Infantis]EIO6025181.1 DNA distortion polypeptide 3 [Salmonella enterica subsp. enterica serovar Enteritidis]EIW2851281.1 DNA distortion polypeptide 3 [Salmonella enterica]MED9543342.1 DNA distortion polypeptide 3 [Escherichia marmotae]QUZ34987.1 DNA distortion polypeptide 3 [Salmonella enterica subsp. enterica serovar Dublin str. CFSAN000517]